jgi:uncharacterized membrane protein YvlD (DUF360 family)
MTRLSKLLRMTLRFLLVWAVDAISLLITALVLPGFALVAREGYTSLTIAAVAALVLGLVNFLIRPIILLVARPFGMVVTFVVGFFVNALALIITAALLPGLQISGLLPAVIGGLVLAAVNTVLTGLLTLDDSDSFYEQRIRRLAQSSPFPDANSGGQGLLVMEIDGVSYRHMQQALALGYMPTLRSMVEDEGYVLTQIDCGLPSQTSACQAGILFGDNDDIPAFRWFDKQQKKLYVSSSDAAEINRRHATGNGLMRGGSSINNMFDGDAEKAMLTLSKLRADTPAEGKRRAEDVYLLMLNPYFFTRTLALFLGEALRDVWQGFKQKVTGTWPRLNRLKKGYPFKRAATTVLLRDVAHSLVILDIMRGSPSICTTFAGYDKVAHFSGPWSNDAFSVLKRFDREVAHMRDILERRASRPYELILLSDHGQSSGPTFAQRYQIDLETLIQRLMPQGATVVQTAGGDDGDANVFAMGAELQNAYQQDVGSRTGQAVARRAGELSQRNVEEQQDAVDAAQAADADVIVCATGNLAHIYFDAAPRKLTHSELNAAYPGLVDGLVQHEGVGFVVVYADDGAPIVIGRQGSRHLVTGEVSGEDPLLPYAVGSAPPVNQRSRGAGLAGQAAVDVRVWQVRRMAEFPNAGDLIVNGTLYPDGTVAAFEELIGNHGGLGGEQTDAFILHPAAMPAPKTRNSAEVFAILDARRGLPPAAATVRTRPEEVDPWSPDVLWQGLKDAPTWLGRAGRAILLDQSAYREVANDPYSTGPALLIGLTAQILASLIREGQLDLLNLATTTGLWFVTVLVLWAAGRALRGSASFTSTLRAAGFAESANFIFLLGVFPAIRPLASLAALVVSLCATWLGVAVAHNLRGWRTLVLPLVFVVVNIVGLVVIDRLMTGAALTVQTIGQTLGLTP